MPVSLTVMSYNVRYDDPAQSTNGWRHRRDAVAGVVRFHGPDVVGLQEALHDQLADLRDRLPRYRWLSAGRRRPERAGEYAAIGFDRTRFNLETQATRWLSERPSVPGSVGWDAALPRLVRAIRLRDDRTGTEFHMFNTHFDHCGEVARLRSAELLRDWIDDRARNAPVIVTGDFNCRAGSPPYRLLTGRDMASEGRTLRDTHRVARHDHHGPTTTVTDFRNLVPDKKIDHVLVSSDVEPILHGVTADTYGDGRYPSDHLPVVAKVALPSTRTVAGEDAETAEDAHDGAGEAGHGEAADRDDHGEDADQGDHGEAADRDGGEQTES